LKFTLSPEQTQLRESVTRYCKEHYSLRNRALILKSPGGFSRAHWTAFAELGWLGAAFPEDVGGTNGSAIESTIILEQFGRSLVVEPYWSYIVFAGQLINSFASVRQRSELLTPIIQGKLLVSVAHNEFESTGRLDHVNTTATLEQCGYTVNGHKSLAFGGPSADKFIVSARTDGKTRDLKGIVLFAIDRQAAGLQRRDYRMIDGTPASDLTLKNVKVSRDALIGSVDGGLDALEFAKNQASVALCAEAVGVMEAVLFTTRNYLRLRRQYGVTLNTLQALQHRMADMFVEVELSRSILFRALSLLDDEDPANRHIGALSAKVHVGQSGKFVCKNGVQLHGGLGMTEDHIIGQYFKRLAVISNIFGSAQHQINECADLLTATLVSYGSERSPEAGLRKESPQFTAPISDAVSTSLQD
jgi:alkylation response protein AidB-like acyl-CoA dehydrogenase